MFSWLYGKITNFRNVLYKKGVLKSYSLGAKTVSIGNITVGGTGKTPLVARVAEFLAESGEKVCVLSRGYGRENPKSRVLVSDGENVLAEAKFAGDEPFELANKLLKKASVISDANRVAAADWAREKFNITAFVLDDAFQHQRAERDLNVVCIDATKPFKDYKMLPFGTLREPLENLKRADLIVITRANLVDEEQISNFKFQISTYTNCPIFTAKNTISKITELSNVSSSKDRRPKIKDQISLSFCALGNPHNFFEQLRREKFNLVATRTFPDHHFYTQKDVAKIEKSALEKNAEILLTTAKDAVKLKNLKFNLPCFVVESAMIFDDEKGFRKMLENLIQPNGSK
jgi:tetraacyldisaccharide 4'-kinase